ncbi:MULTISPECIES: TetR/AcrR family transcriptional regulator [Amycolatopsis]|uniref:TetR family transcriptional regulator n=1 Tax=Amycolatopsis bullii TaxID=941987 RepID=A0ABQ3K4P8_9PSEU|nr:TetR/AcrR family transcriptional regulator [Amycolatopsis bullii]GHF99795.1 TetR family transcriptional regulator [Amycolatopsis bullii]
MLAEDPRATIQRIADEAGVVRLTVYRRYPGRDALRRAIFDVAAVEAREAIPANPVDDPVAGLRVLIVEMAAIARRYPLLVAEHDVRPLASPEGRALQRTVLGLVRRGQDLGVLRADLPAQLLPQAIVGTLRTPGLAGEQVADLLLDGVTVRGRRSAA